MADVDELSALLGGPAINPDGPPRWPHNSPDIHRALLTGFETGTWGQYHGGLVEQLERRLADWHQVPQVWTCASGTFAVEAALRALGVGPGTEVILAGYDYEPSFLTIHALGAQPVLVDVLPDQPTIDPSLIEAAITPTTKAILATHLHGALVPMQEVCRVAQQHRIPVVEDAAQATGAIVDGRVAGTTGDLGVLSFGGSKLLSAGRGGAILASTPPLAQRVRLSLMRGVQALAPMSELQASVLLAQLDGLPALNERRAAAVARIRHDIDAMPGITVVPEERPNCRSAYYKLGFYLNETKFGIDRDLFCRALRAEGIAMDPGLRALHVGRSASRYRSAGPLTQATVAGSRMVTLHHPVLAQGNDGGALVAAAIVKTYRNASRLRSAAVG